MKQITMSLVDTIDGIIRALGHAESVFRQLARGRVVEMEDRQSAENIAVILSHVINALKAAK